MPVPYGFGVGDVVAVGTLAWRVYKSCKAAPESFDGISTEVISLHAVLKECEETVFDRPLQPTRAERLIVIKNGCDKVLMDLQSLVDKYQSLGTQSKRTWDRMKWGNEDIAEIRARLISCTTMLSAFIGTSQSNIESKLDQFMEEYRQGRRDASVLSLQSVDSLSTDDKAMWRSIRKELEDIGISVAAFDTNRKFIFQWFIRAVEAGAFEDQRSISDENDYSDEPASPSNDECVSHDVGRETRHTQSASSTSVFEERPSVQPHPSYPKSESSRTVMASPSRQVGFPPIPVTYSRLPHDNELHAMKAFARHASHCSTCAHPYEFYRKGGSLCSRGHQRAHDVCQYVVIYANEIFSTVDLDNDRRVQVEIPGDCIIIRELMKAMERGLRLHPKIPVISRNESLRLLERGRKESGEITASTRVFKTTHVSLIADFLAALSRPGPRLLRAVETADFSKAHKILGDEASLKHLDLETLDQTLFNTTLLEGLGSSDHLSLISELIARGANVDHTNRDFSGQTPLWNCVARNSIAAVRLLIENGADVNYYGSKSEPANAKNNRQDWFAPRLALTEGAEMLRLLSASADVSALYKIPLTDHNSESIFVRVTLLHEAALLEAIPAMTVLLLRFPNVDSLSPSYGTALMVALLKGTKDTAKFLLTQGANPNINIDPEYIIDHRARYQAQYKMFFGRLYKTPIEAAIVGGKLSMVKLLLKSGVLLTQSTLDFAEDVWLSNRDYNRSLDEPRSWDVHRSWELVGNRSRQDREIVKFLEEALKHQKH